MKKQVLIILLGIMIYSCSQNCSQKEEIQLVTNKKLQSIIDSVTLINNNQNIYELFVHKIEGYRGFMLLHIGTDAFYDGNMLSLSYFLSNNHKIRIYSGLESYFNLPDKEINYGRTEGIWEDKNNLLWGIYMYKDSVIGIYPVDSANPFLLIPSPPFTEPNPIIE